MNISVANTKKRDDTIDILRFLAHGDNAHSFLSEPFLAPNNAVRCADDVFSVSGMLFGPDRNDLFYLCCQEVPSVGIALLGFSMHIFRF